MAVLPLAPWAPDSAAVDTKVTDTVLNAYPIAAGYGPVRDLVPISSALPADAKGGCSVTLPDGSTAYFAGTAGKLFRFDPVTKGWIDVSSPTTTYAVPDEDYWAFARFGSWLIATHINAPPQRFDLVGGTHFEDLVGSGIEDPPRARCVTVVGDTLMLFGLVDFPDRVAWSALNDITGWDPGVDGSDIQQFPDGGFVVAVTGGEYGLIFQQTKIRRMTATGNILDLFQFSLAEEDRGALSPWCVVKIGARVFFLDTDGFYQFADGASAPIGAHVVNRWFVTNSDRSRLLSTFGVADPAGSRVLFAFRGEVADSAVMDQVMIYDWLLERWSLMRLPARCWLRAATIAKSIDEMMGSIDEMTESLDSGLFVGGMPTLAAIDESNRLVFQDGGTLAATIETGDAMLARPSRSFVRGVRLSGDAANYAIAVGGREDLSAPAMFRPAQSRSPTGFCPARSSARYHRARVSIPAGEAWSYASAVEPDAAPAGMR